MKTNYLLLAMLLVAATDQAFAQVVTPNPTPTVITTSPYIITASGFYQLGADLSYAGNGSTNDAIITIAAPNVTLDFGGHFISGPTNNTGTTLLGVYAFEHANINIQNGTISHCYNGVDIEGNGQPGSQNVNQRLSNLLIKTCYLRGIYFDQALYSQINDCRISFIGSSGTYGVAYGIEMDGPGRGNQVNRNVVTDVNGGSQTGIGIYCNGGNAASTLVAATGNSISTVTGGTNNGGAYLMIDPGFAVGNLLSNCNFGLGFDTSAGVYQNNLTLNCATSFGGGVDAGGNH